MTCPARLWQVAETLNPCEDIAGAGEEPRNGSPTKNFTMVEVMGGSNTILGRLGMVSHGTAAAVTEPFLTVSSLTMLRHGVRVVRILTVFRLKANVRGNGKVRMTGKRIRKSIYLCAMCAGLISASFPMYAESAEGAGMLGNVAEDIGWDLVEDAIPRDAGLEQQEPRESFAENTAQTADQTTAVPLDVPAQPRMDGFTDLSFDDWYYPYVEALVEKGIVKGTSETEFSPGGTFTAAECAAVITRILNLENQAAEHRERLIQNGLPGAETWYSGYLQLMHEAGIMDVTGYGASLDPIGNIMVVDPARATMPVNRTEFAAMMVRSFELDHTLIRANNTYHEIGGLGHEWIAGGSYEEAAFRRYAEDIADFDAIPVSEADYVLKAYYNGLFNGDDAGNFNPDSLLTRAEMSKVVAAVTDYRLRSRKDYRSLAPAVTQDDFVSDPFGEQYLSQEKAYEILYAAAGNGLSVQFDGDVDRVRCVQTSIAPMGYAVDVLLYRSDKESGGFTPAGSMSLADPGAQNTPCETILEIDDGVCGVLFVLRNVSEGGRPEGALCAVLVDHAFVYENRVASAY